MSFSRTCLVWVLAAIAAGCGPTPEEPLLSLSPDRSSFDGKTERVVVRIRGWALGGIPAEGAVRLTSPVGHFVEGEVVTLTEGFATATYVCSPEEEAACSGSVRLAAEWGEVNATTQVYIAAALVITPVTWEVVSTRTAAALLAIATSPDGSAWAVGERGAVVQLIGRQWHVIASPVRTRLRAITFDMAGNPVIVGDEGVMLRWLDGALRRQTFPDSGSFTAVAVDGDGLLHVGSEAGLLSTLVGDELEAKLDLRTPVLGMAPLDGDVWASGDGLLARFSASQWMNLPMPLTAKLTVVQSGSDGLWLGGERQGATSVTGVVVEGPNPSWRSTLLPEPVKAFAEVPGVPERFALTTAHLYRQLEGAQWKAVEVPAAGVAMTSRKSGDLVIVGPAGFSLLRK
ncbi:MAG: hypothetical protein Q8N23_32910 [Archangium sp.]|nr:hypothetical protein [Archangium sp.]MDP3157516.1 hypothetical protein [Archangium sp.]MDP3572803.1 hypothetical protein [Archangium sp.]